MKIGDIVLCGKKETVGIIVRFDVEGDPVVYEPSSGITAGMWRNRVMVVRNESR